MRYRSPKALEQAVKAAARRSGRDVGKAIAAFWRDRLLCRVFSTPEPEFVLKGGQGMLAKVPDARETRDIDLLGTSGNLDEALDELKALSSKDLGDYLTSASRRHVQPTPRRTTARATRSPSKCGSAARSNVARSR